MTRRIVFLDVDGTLIDHGQRMVASVPEAIRRARRAGHLLFVCTGRSRTEIPQFIMDIGFDGVISAGGGYIERDGELVVAHTMQSADVRDLKRLFADNDIEYILQAYDAAYPSPGLRERMVPRLQAHVAESDSGGGEHALETLMTYLGPAPDHGIAKATFFGEQQSTFATVKAGADERFHVITGSIPYLGESGGEVSLRGVNKGAAITELVEMLGASLKDVIAIGDSVNDLEMLEVAGVGIAMDNASDTVKASADEITGPVDTDGVWDAFCRHGLV